MNYYLKKTIASSPSPIPHTLKDAATSTDAVTLLESILKYLIATETTFDIDAKSPIFNTWVTSLKNHLPEMDFWFITLAYRTCNIQALEWGFHHLDTRLALAGNTKNHFYSYCWMHSSQKTNVTRALELWIANPDIPDASGHTPLHKLLQRSNSFYSPKKFRDAASPHLFQDSVAKEAVDTLQRQFSDDLELHIFLSVLETLENTADTPPKAVLNDIPEYFQDYLIDGWQNIYTTDMRSKIFDNLQKQKKQGHYTLNPSDLFSQFQTQFRSTTPLKAINIRTLFILLTENPFNEVCTYLAGLLSNPIYNSTAIPIEQLDLLSTFMSATKHEQEEIFNAHPTIMTLFLAHMKYAKYAHFISDYLSKTTEVRDDFLRTAFSFYGRCNASCDHKTLSIIRHHCLESPSLYTRILAFKAFLFQKYDTSELDTLSPLFTELLQKVSTLPVTPESEAALSELISCGVQLPLTDDTAALFIECYFKHKNPKIKQHLLLRLTETKDMQVAQIVWKESPTVYDTAHTAYFIHLDWNWRFNPDPSIVMTCTEFRIHFLARFLNIAPATVAQFYTSDSISLTHITAILLKTTVPFKAASFKTGIMTMLPTPGTYLMRGIYCNNNNGYLPTLISLMNGGIRPNNSYKASAQGGNNLVHMSYKPSRVLPFAKGTPFLVLITDSAIQKAYKKGVFTQDTEIGKLDSIVLSEIAPSELVFLIADDFKKCIQEMLLVDCTQAEQWRSLYDARKSPYYETIDFEEWLTLCETLQTSQSRQNSAKIIVYNPKNTEDELKVFLKQNGITLDSNHELLDTNVSTQYDEDWVKETTNSIQNRPLLKATVETLIKGKVREPASLAPIPPPCPPTSPPLSDLETQTITSIAHMGQVIIQSMGCKAIYKKSENIIIFLQPLLPGQQNKNSAIHARWYQLATALGGKPFDFDTGHTTRGFHHDTHNFHAWKQYDGAVYITLGDFHSNEDWEHPETNPKWGTHINHGQFNTPNDVLDKLIRYYFSAIVMDSQNMWTIKHFKQLGKPAPDFHDGCLNGPMRFRTYATPFYYEDGEWSVEFSTDSITLCNDTSKNLTLYKFQLDYIQHYLESANIDVQLMDIKSHPAIKVQLPSIDLATQLSDTVITASGIITLTSDFLLVVGKMSGKDVYSTGGGLSSSCTPEPIIYYDGLRELGINTDCFSFEMLNRVGTEALFSVQCHESVFNSSFDTGEFDRIYKLTLKDITGIPFQSYPTLNENHGFQEFITAGFNALVDRIARFPAIYLALQSINLQIEAGTLANSFILDPDFGDMHLNIQITGVETTNWYMLTFTNIFPHMLVHRLKDISDDDISRFLEVLCLPELGKNTAAEEERWKSDTIKHITVSLDTLQRYDFEMSLGDDLPELEVAGI